METKICKTCGEELPIIKFGKRYYKNDGSRYDTCHACLYKQRKSKPGFVEAHRLEARERARRNIEENIKRATAWGKVNPDKVKTYDKRYRERNRDKINERARKQRVEESEQMTDYYIKTLINSGMKIDFKDISPEMIELKRKQLKLKRYVKEQRNAERKTA